MLVAPAAATHVSLRLEPGQTLRGSIIDGATGRGLPSVRVRVIEDALSGSNLTAESGEDGRFTVRACATRRIAYRSPHPATLRSRGRPWMSPRARARALLSPLSYGAPPFCRQVLDEQNAPLAGVEIETPE